MSKMMNGSTIMMCMLVFTFLFLVNFVNCLSSREARTLNKKFELMRNGIENKLVSAMVEIDDIRDSVGNCSCRREPNVTLTDQTQIFVENPTNEKTASMRFSKQKVQIIVDQTKLQVHGGWTDWAPWEQCSVTCGIGLSLRKRECSNKNSGPQGNPCIGEFSDVKICMLQECSNAVHGGWTNWAPWEQCSVTCGIGLSIRERECSNPPPGPHGSPCIGEYTDTKMCMINECIQLGDHGGWSVWSRWGECSQTCGTGIQQRGRSCSTPSPGPNANPCVGDNTDMTICMTKECLSVDGGWSDWTTWSTCTATCNGGLMTRDRTCNNPRPSYQGRYCDGRNMDSQLCNTQACLGHWGGWSSWGSCSQTCDTGLMKRHRHCSGQQGSLSSPCSGEYMNVKICMLRKCSQDPIVFFTVVNPRMINNVVVFRNKTDTSSGNEYSTTTGKFTCRIPGLYHFSVYFTSHLKTTGSDADTYCYIIKNNVRKAAAFNSAFGKSGTYTNWRSASVSVYVNLGAGDTVWVGECEGWDNIYKGSSSPFIGALITAS